MTLDKRVKNIKGQVFGSLTALHYSHSSNRQAYWVYQCVCGKQLTARGNTITYEAKKGNPLFPSCGCQDAIQKTKHGFRKATNTHPLYRVYRGMMTRCYDENSKGYPAYGGKGVTVCDEWKDNPAAFIEWGLNNGWTKGLTIDKDIICMKLGINPRIYSPHTCQFIPKKVNSSLSSKRSNYGNHPNIRLSQDEVNDLLHLYFTGQETNQSELARLFGYKSPSSVGRLIKLAKGLG